MLTLEALQEMRLTAQMCDDYSQYKREMAAVEQLERDMGLHREAPAVRQEIPVIPKIPSRGHKARDINHALEMMEEFFSTGKIA